MCATVTLALLALLALPAAASPGGEGVGDSPAAGFTLTFVLLIVGGTVFALVWRAVSKKRGQR